MVFRQIEMEIMASFIISFVVGYTRLYDCFNDEIDSTQTALVYGISITIFVMISYPFTKCHFTPVLTIAEMVFKRISIKEGVTLLFSQFVGISLSVAIQLICLNDKQRLFLTTKDIGYNTIEPDFTVWNHFWIELVFSAIYVYLCFELSNPKVKGQYWIEYYAVSRGLMFTIALLVGETMRFVVLNPTIVGVTMLFNQGYAWNQWSYILGPLAGLILGGLLHNTENIESLVNELRITN